MGEIKFEKKALVEAINTTLQETEQTTIEQSVAASCGRFHVRWDEDGRAQHYLFKLRQNAGVECLIERPRQQAECRPRLSKPVFVYTEPPT